MSSAGERLFIAALALPDTPEEVASAWKADIARRIAMSGRGEGQWLTEEEVSQRLDSKYGPLPG